MVCAGIIGMHQLAGGNHHAGSGVTTSNSPVAAAAHPGMATEDLMASDPAPGSMSPASLATTYAQSVDESMGGLGGACMTVLLAGLLVLAARTAGWTAQRELSTATGPARTGGPRPGRGPPRDLLAQLCVLRT